MSLDFDHDAALEACARGEQFALQAIYERESRWLLSVAMRIARNRELAHDVLQDAFVQIWQRAGTYQRALGSGRGWIYTIVRHRALDEARRAERETPMGDELTELIDSTATHTDTGPDLDDAALQYCLSQLDDDKRQCVVDAYLEGYTHEQIAQRRNRPVGTIKSWVRRGLLALKECLT